MLLLGSLVHLLTVPQDRRIPTIVALRRRHEFQAAVLVLMVVPLHKFKRPVPRFLDTGERLARVVRPVFASPE